MIPWVQRHNTLFSHVIICFYDLYRQNHNINEMILILGLHVLVEVFGAMVWSGLTCRDGMSAKAPLHTQPSRRPAATHSPAMERCEIRGGEGGSSLRLRPRSWMRRRIGACGRLLRSRCRRADAAGPLAQHAGERASSATCEPGRSPQRAERPGERGRLGG